MSWTDAEARERVGRVDGLLGAVEELAEPARRTALEAVGALVDIYGEALRRIAGGADLASDELVSHLLIVHDVHPAPVEARVEGALEEVRPYLASHGGGVDLLGIEDGVVRLALRGHCDGCAASAATLKGAVEDAVRAAAPEIDRIEADGAVEVGDGIALPMAQATVHEAPGPCLPMAAEAR